MRAMMRQRTACLQQSASGQSGRWPSVPPARPRSLRSAAARRSGAPPPFEQPAVSGAGGSSLLALLALLQPAASHADEAAPPDATEAAAAAGPSALSYAVVLAPIILYAIFSIYRDKVNPRAKISDFLFIVAAVLVFANLVSILAFKVRLF